MLLTATPDTVAEGGGATQVTVTATLDGAARATETEVTVTVGDSDPTGVGFAAVEPFTLTIAANAASGSASFTLTPADDAWDRADTAVSLTATAAATELTLGSPGDTSGEGPLALGTRHRPPHRRRRGVDPRRPHPVGGRGGGSGRRHRR